MRQIINAYVYHESAADKTVNVNLHNDSLFNIE